MTWVGTQHAPKEELKIFWSTLGVYDTAKFKSFGCLAANDAQQGKQSGAAKTVIVGTWNKKDEHEKTEESET